MRLIDLDNTIDFSYKPEASKEANCAGKQKEEEYHYSRVPKIEERRSAVLNREFCDKVMATIYEQINGCEARCQKRSPPPMIVFRA